MKPLYANHYQSLTNPAGMEKMFLEIGKSVAADTLLPIPQMTPSNKVTNW